MEIYSIPSEDELAHIKYNLKPHYRLNDTPMAVVFEGALSKDECDEIIGVSELVSPYKFPGCDAAETRELPWPIPLNVFDPIESLARMVNDTVFKFDLDPDPIVWMQTYRIGNGYKPHVDGDVGLTRKLTAVALLSDPNTYNNGYLMVRTKPGDKWTHIPKTQGTIIVFVPWMEHCVETLTGGERKSINMGFYGPAFR